MWDYNRMPGLPEYARVACQKPCARCGLIIGSKRWVYLTIERVWLHADCCNMDDIREGGR